MEFTVLSVNGKIHVLQPKSTIVPLTTTIANCLREATVLVWIVANEKHNLAANDYYCKFLREVTAWVCIAVTENHNHAASDYNFKLLERSNCLGLEVARA